MKEISMTRYSLHTNIAVIFICCFSSILYAVDSFPLEQVTLLDGPFKHAQDLNIHTLLEYDVDRLLAPYLKEAGLDPKAESYPNWIGLDGHIGGHYLSALALYVASTGNQECKTRMDYMIDQLQVCQNANGNGYAGGVPNSKEVWSQVAAGNPKAVEKAWVPWYNLHKTYAGLRDAYIYGKNPKAKDILIKFADWADNLLANYSDDQMETMMNTEYGGMNEIFADVYEITGDHKYLDLAKRFSHRQLLIPMSEGRDTLDNKHANTQVPKAIGFQRIAELSHDDQFDRAAHFFWQTVVDNRTIAFGGNSRREHFPAADACMEMIEEREGPESCNTYNMLKLSEGLFRMNPDAKYADYYERALYNHILSTQHPDHGGYVYFTPARPRHYRVYSAPNQGMWCCVGSGMENHAQYGRFIYSHTDDSLYVNLFIASELDWKQKGIRLTQQTSFPDDPTTTLTVSTDNPVDLTLNVRHPNWVPQGRLQFRIGDTTWNSQSSPSSYTKISRTWHNGDKIQITLAMHITTEPMPNVPEYNAVLYGPILLAARTGTEDLKGLIADDQRWSHIAHGQLLPLTESPVFIADTDTIPAHIDKLPGSSQLKFTTHDLIQPSSFADLTLEPFFGIHDSRYSMYFQTIGADQYAKSIAAARAIEQQNLLLDKLTIDRVIPGEQQPESDHFMKTEGSESGNYRNKPLRHALAPAWFSYELRVEPSGQNELLVGYWGNENFKRTFDILVDDKLLVTENTVGKWNKDDFVDSRYPIPTDMTQGKQKITVTFKPHPDNWAGGIFDLRILKSE